MLTNHIFDRTFLTIPQSRQDLRQLCIALGSCYAPDVLGKDNVIVPIWTNSLDMSNLNIARLKHWQDYEINEYRYIDVYNEISTNTHSNITEGLALSEFLNDFYSKILFASQFRSGVKDLLNMYEMNEAGIEINEIFKKNSIKLKLKNPSNDIYFKFKEILKFSLLSMHMTAINFKGLKPLLNKTLDHLLNDVKKNILDDYVN